MLRYKPTIGAVAVLLATIALPLQSADSGEGPSKPLSRFAFGSCAQQDKPQPIWEAVVKAKPQLFVSLGDNIYADTEDMDVMRAKYALLARQPGYQKLKKTCPVVATWDDHDYGANDAGAEYPKKRESQQVFLDFFGVPQDDPPRAERDLQCPGFSRAAFRRIKVLLGDCEPIDPGWSAPLHRASSGVPPGPAL